MKKRVVIFSVVLSLLFANNVSAWSTYFGLNEGWYEGMKARIITNEYNKWTVKVDDIGWGGCWGGQVSKKVKIKKNQKYRISFTIKSTKMSKWVFVKLANNADSKKYAWAKWINCKKGKTVKVNKTFKAKHSARRICFGIGGDFGDRRYVQTDTDAKQRYKIAPIKKLDAARLPSDYAASHPTTIKLKKFKIKHIIPKKKKKKRKKKNHSSSSSDGQVIYKKVIIYYY